MRLKIFASIGILIAAGLAAGYLWLAAGASPVYGRPPLAGVALIGYGQTVRIAGQHLRCASAGPDALQAECALDLGGQPLRVTVAYTDTYHDGFGQCTAAYGAQSAPCTAVNFVTQSPALAGVDPAALNIPPAAVPAAAAQYPGSLWQESDWTWSMFGMEVLAALLAGFSIAVWVSAPPFSRNFWITAGLAALALFFLLNIGLSTVISGLALVD